jgi:hypothetical protein
MGFIGVLSSIVSLIAGGTTVYFIVNGVVNTALVLFTFMIIFGIVSEITNK